MPFLLVCDRSFLKVNTVCYIIFIGFYSRILTYFTIPKACVRSYAEVFPQSGQLQPVCGTDALRITPSAAVYPRIQAGKVNGHQFYRLHALSVCHNRRIASHKVFKTYAARGKTSTGWFYGFKLHLVINDRGRYSPFA
jgi:hypothetical protein